MTLAINSSRPALGIVAAIATVSALLTACGAPPSIPGAGSSLQVIAGENFWGSIAAQLGGSHVSVTSIVTNPNTDPHDYESSAVDARAFATADYVILNGGGYDDWGGKLLEGNRSDNRRVLSVAGLLQKKAGANPHFWYNPDWVATVADRMTADYKALDPGGSSYYSRQREAFSAALKPYHDAITSIRSAHGGVPVGSTESIFVYMAAALDLDLTSPPQFMQAISEGTDPAAQSVAQIQQQISQRSIKLLVYNTQTSTSVTENLKQLARRNGVPVVGISETLQPANASFQDWQVAQLNSIKTALDNG